MKKRILSVLIATALAVSVTGCAGNATSSSDNTSASSVAESSDTSTQTSSDASSEDESKEESSQEESKDLEANYTKYTLDGDLTQHMIDMSRLNEGNKVRLANVIKKLKNGEEVTVGFIGGSITQGTSAGNDLCYAKLTADWLQKTYSSCFGTSLLDKDYLYLLAKLLLIGLTTHIKDIKFAMKTLEEVYINTNGITM